MQLACSQHEPTHIAMLPVSLLPTRICSHLVYDLLCYSEVHSSPVPAWCLLGAHQNRTELAKAFHNVKLKSPRHPQVSSIVPHTCATERKRNAGQ